MREEKRGAFPSSSVSLLGSLKPVNQGKVRKDLLFSEGVELGIHRL